MDKDEQVEAVSAVLLSLQLEALPLKCGLYKYLYFDELNTELIISYS